MSTISKLGISGIRSYSPDTMELIDFKPLTLICGENGSGKTTIIEALKFITTGVMPVGTQGGKSFVCDPKLVSRPEVVGEVKLNFSNYSGKKFAAGKKVMLSYVKRKGVQKVQFKSIEQVIKTRNENDEVVSVNHHCAAIDKQIPALFGVSKSVLDNVIFCQQDEALWPFGDNSTLKGIFDELFQTLQYAKAYNIVKESHKRYSRQIRQIHIIIERERKESIRLAKARINHQFQYQEIEKQSKTLPKMIAKIRQYQKKNDLFVSHQKQLLEIAEVVGKLQADMNNVVKEIHCLGTSEEEMMKVQSSQSGMRNLGKQLRQIQSNLENQKLEIKRLEEVLEDMRLEELENQVGNTLELEIRTTYTKYQFSGDVTLSNVMGKLQGGIKQMEASQAILNDFKKQLITLKDHEPFPVRSDEWDSLTTKLNETKSKCASIQNRCNEIYHQLSYSNLGSLKKVEWSQSNHNQLLNRLKNSEYKLSRINTERETFLLKQQQTSNKQTIDQIQYATVTLREQMLNFAKSNSVCTFCSKELSDGELHQIEQKCKVKIDNAKEQIERMRRDMNSKGETGNSVYSSLEEINLEQKKLKRDVEGLYKEIQSSNELSKLYHQYNEERVKLDVMTKMDYYVKQCNVKIKRASQQSSGENVTYNIDDFIHAANNYALEIQRLKSVSGQLERLEVILQSNKEREGLKRQNDARRKEIYRESEAIERSIQPLYMYKEALKKIEEMKAKKEMSMKPKSLSRASKDNVESELQTKRQLLEELLAIKVSIEREMKLNEVAGQYQPLKASLQKHLKKREYLQGEINERKDEKQKAQKLSLDYISLKTMIETRIKNIQIQESKQSEYQQLNMSLKIKEQMEKQLTHTMNSIELTLAQFHSQKLDQINRILKQTWQSIYRTGDYHQSDKDNDIQYIKIRSIDEENKVEQNKKKPYCYALMMGVDGNEIQMKGRCSMGQKVLASIVIRLALAECFAIKCNILALDEPTANLDANHARRLAEALGRLIENRKQEMQLIIISHDSDFMQMMTRYTPNYYQVKKVDGWSRITLNQWK